MYDLGAAKQDVVVVSKKDPKVLSESDNAAYVSNLLRRRLRDTGKRRESPKLSLELQDGCSFAELLRAAAYLVSSSSIQEISNTAYALRQATMPFVRQSSYSSLGVKQSAVTKCADRRRI